MPGPRWEHHHGAESSIPHDCHSLMDDCCSKCNRRSSHSHFLRPPKCLEGEPESAPEWELVVHHPQQRTTRHWCHLPSSPRSHSSMLCQASPARQQRTSCLDYPTERLQKHQRHVGMPWKYQRVSDCQCPKCVMLTRH